MFNDDKYRPMRTYHELNLCGLILWLACVIVLLMGFFAPGFGYNPEWLQHAKGAPISLMVFGTLGFLLFIEDIK